MLIRQRRTQDPAKRREIVFDIQKYLAKQQYYVQMPSPSTWPAGTARSRNYAPNHGYDYGGRLMAAWLDR
jgi:ABC-type transport system substrate-binding protein